MLEDNIIIPSGVDTSRSVSETTPRTVEYSCSRDLGLEWQLQPLSGQPWFTTVNQLSKGNSLTLWELSGKKNPAIKGDSPHTTKQEAWKQLDMKDMEGTYFV